MPGPAYRDTFFNGMGSSHVYKTGTANSTAAEVLAAVTAKRYRLKSYIFRVGFDESATAAADTALNAFWLADGTTPFLGLGMLNGVDTTTVVADARELKFNSGLIVLPAYGVTGTAATAINIDFTATSTQVTYQLDLWYDLID